MMTEICALLNNYFDRDQPKVEGTFNLIDGMITPDIGIKEGQYIRIIGSALNDGVWLQGDERLRDEEFKGAVWLMAVPPAVISLADEIAAWQAKHGSVESQAMSPYTSESFAGYSYSKNQASDASGLSGWQAAYASRLMRWKKL